MGLEGVYKGLHVLVDSTCPIVPLTVLLRGWCSRWYSWGSHASSPGQRPRWPSAKHSKIWISHYNGNWALFGFRFSIEIHGNGLTCLVQYKPYILTYILYVLCMYVQYVCTTYTVVCTYTCTYWMLLPGGEGNRKHYKWKHLQMLLQQHQGHFT